MAHYMLAAHTREEEQPDVQPEMTAEEKQIAWERIGRLEVELKTAGAWVFSARLHEPGTATVVSVREGKVSMTDGPFAESKDHLAGFYLIDVPDLDSAVGWAAKVAETVGHPIEVRPFAGVAWEPGGGD
jgi:hypothetical protein